MTPPDLTQRQRLDLPPMHPLSGSVKERKRHVDAKLAVERAAVRARRRVERRCFWTWPWGHRWGIGEAEFICLVCGKEPDWDGY